MNYKILSQSPSSHFIDVEMHIQHIITSTIELQLPAWRPGRYELQNFAKNIQNFNIYSIDNQAISFKKITKDRWLVETNEHSEIIVKYNYYANTINAGSSYIDENALYVNPVNLCMYVLGRIDEPCFIEVSKRKNEKIACALPYQKASKDTILLEAADFYELADSPFIISKSLQVESYQVGNSNFHVWFEGNFTPDWSRVLPDFQKFTESQIAIFGEFPQPNYHFITWVLPVAYYHGVEHRHSTMMILGPDFQDFDELYIDLLGLASHELFHAWNICRIRPAELLPYDFTKENYFETCFVAEGVTTYYGDLMLHRSGVFTDAQYQKELEICYRRHFEQADKAAQSLLESSFDLWLDGYSAGIPDRKVSVYHKGAIAAQILDITIRQASNNHRSLDNVMQFLWQRFGKPFIGYTFNDYKCICEEVAGINLDTYFAECIAGKTSLLATLNDKISFLEMQILQNEEGNFYLQKLNLK